MSKSEKAEKILEKVRKLFALSGNNPSEEEAKSAALKAQQLLAEYNLTLTDVESEEKIDISESSVNTGVDNNWKYDLSCVVSKNFRCEHYWMGKRSVVFYGFKADTEVAQQVFEFLFKVCKKRTTQVADKAYNETGSSAGVRFSYSAGFVAGVREALDRQCTALMIVTPKIVTDSYAEKSKSFKTFSTGRSAKNGFDKKFYDEGIKDGRSSVDKRALTN